MLPAAVGGPAGGQLAIGYFHTTNGVTDPNSTDGQWTYTAAISTDATSGTPTFATADVQPGHTFHAADFLGTNALLYPRLGDYAILKPAPTEKDPLAASVVIAGLFDDFWRVKKE